MLREENKEDKSAKIHKHLSTVFILVGIASFVLGGIVNFYTIKRINGK
jgi:nitrogen fixation/metabolism regulation signal transduction histidine kinase